MRVCDIPQKPAELAPPVKTQKREAGLALFFHPSNHYPKSTTSRFSSKQKNPTATTSQCKEWEEWSNLVGSSELWKISSKNGIVVARIAFCCNALLLHPSQSRWHRGDSHSPWLRVASFSAPFDDQVWRILLIALFNGLIWLLPFPFRDRSKKKMMRRTENRIINQFVREEDEMSARGHSAFSTRLTDSLDFPRMNLYSFQGFTFHCWLVLPQKKIPLWLYSSIYTLL